MEKLKGLPGPLIRWFEETIGIEGIADLAEGSKATAKTIIGMQYHQQKSISSKAH